MKQQHLRAAALVAVALFVPSVVQARPHARRPRESSLSWVLKMHLKASGMASLNGATSEHTLYTLQANGLAGTLDEYSAEKKFRVDMSLGPIHMVSADDGIQGWEQDTSGNVRIVRGPELTEQRAAENFSLETYDPLEDAKLADVKLRTLRDPQTHDFIIDATPSGGSAQTLYVNPRTFLVDKMIVSQEGLNGTVAITAYRSVGGVETPSALAISYAGLPVQVTAELKSAEYGVKIDNALFHMPVSARDFEFLQPSPSGQGSAPVSGGSGAAAGAPSPGQEPASPGAADSATIPISIEDGEIVVPVSIDGHSLRFVLDSGSAGSFVSATAAQTLNLPTEGNMTALGYGGAVKTGIATHTTITVGDTLLLKGTLIYVTKIPVTISGSKGRIAIDGGLGYDIFARFRVRIDYQNDRLTISAPDYVPPSTTTASAKALELPITLQNHIPTIAAAIDKNGPARFMIDTGDNGDIRLYAQYANKHKLWNSASAPRASVQFGYGVGGVVKEVATPGHTLTIGGVAVKDVTVSTTATSGISDVSDFAGGIGNDVLQRYVVTFDYPDNILRLETPAQPAVGVAGVPSEPLLDSVSHKAANPPVAAATSAAAAKDAGLTLTDLLNRHLAALGGQAAVTAIGDTQVTAQITTGGATGTVYTAYAYPNKEYEEDKIGILDVKQGYNGKQGWLLDSNGGMRPLAADELADMRLQLYFDTNSYVLSRRMGGHMSLRPLRDPGTGDYVVNVFPDGGKQSTVYFDPRSYLIMRESHKDDSQTTTTTYADYRPFDGVMFPMKQSITNGDPRYDISLAAQQVENNVSLSPKLFDPPHPIKNFTFLKPGATSASTHFDLDNNEIAIPVAVNGLKERMLFDTGASSIALSRSVADALKLREGGILQAIGYGGSTDLRPIEMDSLEIPGAIRLSDVVGVSVNMSNVMADTLNKPIAGLVGYDILSQLVVRVDYARQTITFIDPAAFHAAPSDGVALPVDLDNDSPAVTARLDDLPAAQYLIDTGDFAMLRMYQPYISNNKLTQKYPNGVRLDGGGIAGISESLRTRVGRFSLAGVDFTNVPTDLSLDPKGGASDLDAGSIGSGMLSRFRVTFDYPGGFIYFAPEANATRSF